MEPPAIVNAGRGARVPATVPVTTHPHQQASDDNSDSSELSSSLMEDVHDDDSYTSEGLVKWIRQLQRRVEKMEGHKNGLQDQIERMREGAEQSRNEIMGRAQMQCPRDAKTYRKINTLVVEKIFSVKKFITSQSDLDDFNAQNSLGRVIMDRMKVDPPDRLPFWNAYKEIVADAIANRRTAITNDLKKVIMSK
jgi:TolA-binding protein